jgi:hypothetical protein
MRMWWYYTICLSLAWLIVVVCTLCQEIWGGRS